MKLSTLLAMLESDRVFIPSILTLRKDDPTEGQAQAVAWEHFQNLSKAQIALLTEMADGDQMRRMYNPGLVGRPLEKPWRYQILRDIWAEYILPRRAAWCWYGSDLESMSQWKIYGINGVAIRTTLKKLLDEIRLSPSTHLAQCGLVSYWDFDAQPGTPHPNPKPVSPLFTKRVAYQHEKEFRVIFPVLPPDPGKQEPAGILLHMAASELIEEIRVAPSTPDLEVDSLRAIVSGILRRKSGRVQEIPVRRSFAHKVPLILREDTPDVSDSWFDYASLPVISKNEDELALKVADFFPERIGAERY